MKMMSNIKFKAKRIFDGAWVEGYYLEKTYFDGEPDEHFIFWMKNSNIWAYELIDVRTLCRYTGLVDKFKNPLWENDLVKYDAMEWKIIYNEDFARFNLTIGNKYISDLSKEISCNISRLKSSLD